MAKKNVLDMTHEEAVEFSIRSEFEQEYIDRETQKAKGFRGIVARWCKMKWMKHGLADIAILTGVFSALSVLMNGSSTVLFLSIAGTYVAAKEAGRYLVKRDAIKALDSDIRSGLLIDRYDQEVIQEKLNQGAEFVGRAFNRAGGEKGKNFEFVSMLDLTNELRKKFNLPAAKRDDVQDAPAVDNTPPPAAPAGSNNSL